MLGLRFIFFLLLLTIGFVGLMLVRSLVRGRRRMVIENGAVADESRIRMWKWLNIGCWSLMLLLFGLVFSMGYWVSPIKPQRDASSAFHRDISSVLKAYRSHRGEYPSPRVVDVPVVMDGHTYNAAGALMLYQALTGDGNDHISIASGSSSASDGEVSSSEFRSAFMKNVPGGMVRKIDAGYIFVDGFGHPFQYTIPGPDSVNETYDLWSFGDAKPPPKLDKATKQAVEVTDRWIKNW